MSRYAERKLETKTGRASLAVRGKVYLGPQIAPGVRIGFRRGKLRDSWLTSTLLGTGTDDYKQSVFAKAERPGLDANGTSVLDFHQAIARGKKLVGADKHADAPATVAESFDDYEAHLKATGGSLFNVDYARKYMDPDLMPRPLPLLTSKELNKWRNSLLGDLAPASVTRLCKAVRAAFNLAAEHDERVHANRKAWKVGLKDLEDSSGKARNAIISPDKMRAFYQTAYEMDSALGLLMHTLAVTGARPSQVVRLLVSDFLDDPSAPKLMMPRSAKGKAEKRVAKRKERYMVPITLELARQLRIAIKGRAQHERLLLRADHTPWSPKPSDHYRDDVRKIVAGIGEDVRSISVYCLRHSNIVQMLRRGASAQFVGSLHDTSETEIRKHYAAFMAHHHEDFARTLLIDDGPPVPSPAGENVIPIASKTA